MSEWISVKDQLPPSKRSVLVSGGIGYYNAKEDSWYTITDYQFPGLKIQWNVKHWMPLPEPPKQ